MKKEELMKIEGMTDAIAEKVAGLSAEELKSYIPKTRFDEVNEAKKNAEALIKARDAQLEDLKKAGSDTESMKKQIEELQKGNEEAKKQYEADIKKMQIDNAVDNALRDAGAKNIKSVRALLTDLDKAELDDKGIVKGLEDQIKNIQKSDSYLFGAAGQKNMAGMTPGNSGKAGAPDGTSMTREQLEKAANDLSLSFADRIAAKNQLFNLKEE